MYQIRSAQDSDLVQLAQLDKSCFARSWDSSVYRFELHREHAWVVVCQQQPRGVEAGSANHSASARIVGCGILWIVSNEAELIRIAVRPENQRQGVGRALVQAMLNRCEEQNCDSMHLEVASQNLAALHLYRSLGFVKVGLRRAYYQLPPDDALRMSRSIGAAKGDGE